MFSLTRIIDSESSGIFQMPPLLTGLEVKIPTSTCTTSNLIYVCACKTCGVFYVGETGKTLKERCGRHAPKPGDEKVSKRDNWTEPRRHFAEGPCSLFRSRDAEITDSRFWVAPIHLLPPSTDRRAREKMEQRYIALLKPSLNITGRRG